MTLEVIIGLSLIVVVPLVVIWLCYITDSLNSLIYNNRYNKYKSYIEYRKRNDKLKNKAEVVYKSYE